MARRFFVALPGLVLFALLAAHAASAADRAQTYADLVATLAAPDMEGRGPGTAGLDRARDLLVSRLRDAGLRPAFGDDFTQPFTVKLGVEVDRAALALAGTPLEPNTAFTVLGVSGGDGAPFDAGVVFVGYAIDAPKLDYSSFAGMPDGALRGKVALALRYEPMDDRARSTLAPRSDHAGRWSEHASLARKATAVAQRGAVALVIVNPPALDRGASLTPTAFSAGETSDIPVFQIDSAALARALQHAGIDDGGTFLREMQQRADRGEAKPHDLAGLTAAGHATLRRPVANVANVAGVIPGVGVLANEFVVLGAHYDHLGLGDLGSLAPPDQRPALHPGADDNASGTAAVALAAEQLAGWARRLDGHQPPPRRSVLVIFFTAEERGLLGATHFLENLNDAGLTTDQLTAMVNLDMVGRVRNDKLYAFGVGSAAGLSSLVSEAAAGTGLDIVRSDESFGGSDHSAFHFRRVPALHLFSGVHPQYHRPTDTADLINATGGAAVTDLAAALAWQLAHRNDRLVFNEAEMNPHGGAAGGPSGGAYLGVMPDYATLDANDGATLAGVSPGSPAAAAGLRKADRIMKWNDTPIANLRDLTTALRTAAPGDKVILQVQRDGAPVTLDVTLGTRQ